MQPAFPFDSQRVQLEDREELLVARNRFAFDDAPPDPIEHDARNGRMRELRDFVRLESAMGKRVRHLPHPGDERLAGFEMRLASSSLALPTFRARSNAALTGAVSVSDFRHPGKRAFFNSFAPRLTSARAASPEGRHPSTGERRSPRRTNRGEPSLASRGLAPELLAAPRHLDIDRVEKLRREFVDVVDDRPARLQVPAPDLRAPEEADDQLRASAALPSRFKSTEPPSAPPFGAGIYRERLVWRSRWNGLIPLSFDR